MPLANRINCVCNWRVGSVMRRPRPTRSPRTGGRLAGDRPAGRAVPPAVAGAVRVPYSAGPLSPRRAPAAPPHATHSPPARAAPRLAGARPGTALAGHAAPAAAPPAPLDRTAASRRGTASAHPALPRPPEIDPRRAHHNPHTAPAATPTASRPHRPGVQVAALGVHLGAPRPAPEPPIQRLRLDVAVVFAVLERPAVARRMGLPRLHRAGYQQ